MVGLLPGLAGKTFIVQVWKNIHPIKKIVVFF